jgi:hypothetical protein
LNGEGDKGNEERLEKAELGKGVWGTYEKVKDGVQKERMERAISTRLGGGKKEKGHSR